mgnify:CR=1 FL=1
MQIKDLILQNIFQNQNFSSILTSFILIFSIFIIELFYKYLYQNGSIVDVFDTDLLN